MRDIANSNEVISHGGEKQQFLVNIFLCDGNTMMMLMKSIIDISK